MKKMRALYAVYRTKDPRDPRVRRAHLQLCLINSIITLLLLLLRHRHYHRRRRRCLHTTSSSRSLRIVGLSPPTYLTLSLILIKCTARGNAIRYRTDLIACFVSSTDCTSPSPFLFPFCRMQSTEITTPLLVTRG